jgi:NAD(P)-dependent dehydrogenase (short-subunit alcohol dehydrogenase family)
MNLDELKAMYDFSGRTFLVTGGTGVLGGVVAGTLVDVGANVVVLDRSLDPTRGVADFAAPTGWQAKAVHGDVLKRDSLVQAAAAVKTQYGPIYGLINAAGGNSPKATCSPDLSFFDIPEDGMRFVLDLNLLGTMMPCQIFAEQMAETGEGVILNYSSMNAFRPLTNIAAYSASKAGITNFTAWLAVHMAQNYSGKIRVNAIAPGFFLTEQNRFLLTDEQTGELTQRGRTIIEQTPMARFGDPRELITGVLWLLSDGASFVHGAVVPIDGGFTAFSGV